MKLNYIITLGLFVISCSSPAQKETNTIDEFNAFLGQEKAAALTAAVESFDLFLEANFPSNEGKSTEAFLEYYYMGNTPDATWIFQTNQNKEILSAFESSGLRKEIWKYGYEEYESHYNINEILPPEEKGNSETEYLGELDIDIIYEEIVPLIIRDSSEVARRDKEIAERKRNSLRVNSNGQYLYALAKYTLPDTLIEAYIGVNLFENRISPVIFASVFLDAEINYEDPFIKRILVTEFYYDLMQWDIKRKEEE